MNLLSRFRRARRPSSSQSAGRPCGCLQPRFCREGSELVTLLFRGRRIGNQYGQWSDYQQASVELGIHWDRDPAEVWSLVRHPVGR